MNRRHLAFLALILLRSSAWSFDMGVVTDPDGYSNLREQASSSSAVLEKLIVGEIVSVRSREGGWAKVETQLGTTGYVHASRISSIYGAGEGPANQELFETGEAAARSGVNYPLALKYARAGRESALRLFFWMAAHGEFDGAAGEGLAGNLAELLRRTGDEKFAAFLATESAETRDRVLDMLDFGHGDPSQYPRTNGLRP